MTIFDFIKDILYTKKGNLLEDPDNEQQFSSFMICRWMSMYSPDMAKIVNLTYNKLYPVYKSKGEWYQSLLAVIPQSKFKKINYCKKKQKEDIKDDDKLKMKLKLLAKTYQMSIREVELFANYHNIDLKKVEVS